MTEDEIKKRFVTAWNTLDTTRNEVIANCRLAIEALCDQTELEKVIGHKQDEVLMLTLTELTKRYIDENSKAQNDQAAYQKRYNELLKKYHILSADLAVLEQQRNERKLLATRLTAFVDAMEQSRQVLDTFSETLWSAVVEKATVFQDGRITYMLIDGAEIE